LKIAIEIVDCPIKNADFPCYVQLPEGTSNIQKRNQGLIKLGFTSLTLPGIAQRMFMDFAAVTTLVR